MIRFSKLKVTKSKSNYQSPLSNKKGRLVKMSTYEAVSLVLDLLGMLLNAGLFIVATIKLFSKEKDQPISVCNVLTADLSRNSVFVFKNTVQRGYQPLVFFIYSFLHNKKTPYVLTCRRFYYFVEQCVRFTVLSRHHPAVKNKK